MKPTLLVCAAVICSSTVTPLRANPPVPEPGGPRSGTFVPHAGYLVTLKRNQLEQKAAPWLGAPPIGGIRGTRRLPVICVAFKNVEAPFPAADYQEMLFGAPASRKTVTQYYRDVSNGKLNVIGNVLGWYTLPKDDTYYENGQNGGGKPFGELLRIGLDSADNEIDFGEFDNDGPDGVANSGDDDGKVDTVMFVHPELGGEFRKLTPDNIWSHSWHYSEPTYGHTGPFETKDIRKDSNGNPLPGAHGQPQHILVEDYVIQPGLGAPQSGQPKRIIEIGVFCHEFGHALGLPDLYDRTPASGADSAGIGCWCLMAAGSYGGDRQHSETPAEMSAWCKQYLGWANVTTISQDGLLDLEPVTERNQIFRFDVPGTNKKEYFLLEYRNRDWKDPASARINWDEFLPGSGLAVWHIDERVGATFAGSNPAAANPNWPFAGRDAGQNDAPSLPKSNGSSSWWRDGHSLVSLMQADRELRLEKEAGHAGDSADLFITGLQWSDDPQLLCGSRNYAGQASGWRLSDINLANLTLMARLDSGLASAPGAAPPMAPNLPGAGGNAVAALNAANDSAPSGAAKMNVLQATSLDVSQVKTLSKINSCLVAADVAGTYTKMPGADLVTQLSSPTQVMIEQVNDRLKGSTASPLTSGEVDFMKTLTEKEISAGFEPKNRPFVRNLSAKARTRVITSETIAVSAAEQKLIEVLKKQPNSKRAVAQLSPTGHRLERVSELTLPPVTSDIATSAQTLLAGDLGKAVAGNATLERVSTTKDLPGTVTFQQTLQVGGKTLPVWGATATLFYSKEETPTLNTIVSKAVTPEDIKPKGTAGALPIDEAKKIAAAQLQVDAATFVEAKEGVKLFQSDPERARVGIRLMLPVGDQQRNLEIFVDSERKQVLSIE